MRTIVFFVFMSVCLTMGAQVQSDRYVSAVTSASAVVRPDTLSSDSVVAAKPLRIPGFRVQVYSGGNSREAKSKAYQMEHRVRLFFPDYAVYTRFLRPSWVCQIGDFRTRDEAAALLQEMRATGHFDEAIVVKAKINAPVEELPQDTIVLDTVVF